MTAHLWSCMQYCSSTDMLVTPGFSRKSAGKVETLVMPCSVIIAQRDCLDSSTCKVLELSLHHSTHLSLQNNKLQIENAAFWQCSTVCDACRRHYATKCRARKFSSVYEWLQVGRLERSQVKRGDRSL